MFIRHKKDEMTGVVTVFLGKLHKPIDLDEMMHTLIVLSTLDVIFGLIIFYRRPTYLKVK